MKLIAVAVAVAALIIPAVPAVADLAASSHSAQPAVVVTAGGSPTGGGDSGWGG
jgi:hypothetical protein